MLSFFYKPNNKIPIIFILKSPEMSFVQSECFPVRNLGKVGYFLELSRIFHTGFSVSLIGDSTGTGANSVVWMQDKPHHLL